VANAEVVKGQLFQFYHGENAVEWTIHDDFSVICDWWGPNAIRSGPFSTSCGDHNLKLCHWIQQV